MPVPTALSKGSDLAAISLDSQNTANSNGNGEASSNVMGSVASEKVYVPIPRLEDYGISVTRGFLGDLEPVSAIKSHQYEIWEKIAAGMRDLLLAGRLRRVVDDQLDVIDTDNLQGIEERRRAYVILSFIANAYIWGSPSDKPRAILPAQVSVPLCKLSEELEVLPIITYASTVLWNFRLIPFGPATPKLSSDQVAIVQTFRGSGDEAWFYLSSWAIEATGAPAISTLIQAMHHAEAGDMTQLTKSLQSVAETLDEIIAELKRLPEHCDPSYFYWHIRPYLAGSSNMKDAGLSSEGIIYQGVSSQPSKLAGASAAQSPLIQALDIFFGVEHSPTKGHSESEKSNYIYEMRRYMPGPTRRFLEHLQKSANIRDTVHTNQKTHPHLHEAYDACIAMLQDFRAQHFQIVTRYILIPAREADPNASLSKSVATGLARQVAENERAGIRGTGGTSLVPFLKQARDETGQEALSPWARRLINMSYRKSEVQVYDWNANDAGICIS